MLLLLLSAVCFAQEPAPAPADEAPADVAPADEAPSDEAPSDEAPSDEAPAEEAPAELPAEAVSTEAAPVAESAAPLAVPAPADPAPAEPAPAPLEPARWEPEWPRVQRRAHNTFKAGLVTGVSGLGLELAGAATGEPTLLTLGGLGETVGAPIMAGASLRERRALKGMGAPVPGTAGALAWTFWGAGLGSSVAAAQLLVEGEEEAAAALVLGAVALRIGSYAAAGVQGGVNRRARERLGIR